MSLSNIAAYYRPADLEEALRLLREGEGRIVPLGGGTSLVGAPPQEVEGVVDLRDLKLDWIIAREEGGLSLGAMSTLNDLLASEAVREYGGGCLSRAARYAAGSLVRNQGTLGGTLIARAASSDLVAMLLALGASVTLVDDREQSVALDDLYRRRDYLLQPGTLLTELHLPPLSEKQRATFDRIARTPMDQPILSVALMVALDGKRIEEIQIAVTALGEAPTRLRLLEDALCEREIGSEPFNETIERAADGLAIKSDHLASASYRAAMLPRLLRRAILAAAD